MRQIARHGQERRYYHVRVGVNSRLDTLQAAVLLGKLVVFDEEIARRQTVAQQFSSHLLPVPQIVCPSVVAENRSAWAQYTIRSNHRAELQQALKRCEIPTTVHYPLPLNKQPAVEDGSKQLPVGDRLANEVLSLPMGPYLSDSDQAMVAQAIRQFYNENFSA